MISPATTASDVTERTPDIVTDYVARLPHADHERLRYLLRDLQRCDTSRVPFRFLDMGAGSGSMSVGVLLAVSHAEGTLVDVQERLAIPDELAPHIAGRWRSVPWARASELARERFDLVISTDVLEHIIDWRAAFRGLANYVADQGYLYVQTPSKYPSPNWPLRGIVLNQLRGLWGRNHPSAHVRHGLSCKDLFDEARRLNLKPLVAAEDYVIDGEVYCDFKPRCHCLFQKT